MIVAISGTPCTGKTSATKEIKKIADVNIISIHSIFARKKIPYEYDKKRGTKAVSIRDLKIAIMKEIKKEETNVIEGHLAHFLDADLTIILRCRPDILVKRMQRRKWTKSKIAENVQSEILDAATIEALNKTNSVIEIDTSAKKPKEIAQVIKKLLNNYALRKKYTAGRIDWSERFIKYLIEK